MTTKNKIHSLLTETFLPQYLQVDDDSALHHGHPEAKRQGGGHYSVILVTDAFNSKSQVERHRMIYAALRKELKEDIHALGIKACTPDEWKENRSG